MASIRLATAAGLQPLEDEIVLPATDASRPVGRRRGRADRGVGRRAWLTDVRVRGAPLRRPRDPRGRGLPPQERLKLVTVVERKRVLLGDATVRRRTTSIRHDGDAGVAVGIEGQFGADLEARRSFDGSASPRRAGGFAVVVLVQRLVPMEGKHPVESPGYKRELAPYRPAMGSEHGERDACACAARELRSRAASMPDDRVARGRVGERARAMTARGRCRGRRLHLAVERSVTRSALGPGVAGALRPQRGPDCAKLPCSSRRRRRPR